MSWLVADAGREQRAAVRATCAGRGSSVVPVGVSGTPGPLPSAGTENRSMLPPLRSPGRTRSPSGAQRDPRGALREREPRARAALEVQHPHVAVPPTPTSTIAQRASCPSGESAGRRCPASTPIAAPCGPGGPPRRAAPGRGRRRRQVGERAVARQVEVGGAEVVRRRARRRPSSNRHRVTRERRGSPRRSGAANSVWPRAKTRWPVRACAASSRSRPAAVAALDRRDHHVSSARRRARWSRAPRARPAARAARSGRARRPSRRAA